MSSTQYLPDEINKEIRSALWHLHTEGGVSQTEIAKRSGYHKVGLSRFMRGHVNVNFDTARQLLAVCDLRLNIEILPVESEES